MLTEKFKATIEGKVKAISSEPFKGKDGKEIAYTLALIDQAEAQEAVKIPFNPEIHNLTVGADFSALCEMKLGKDNKGNPLHKPKIIELNSPKPRAKG